MRRVLLVCAAITFAIACTDNITEPTPDRPLVTAGTGKAGTVAFATTTTEDGLSISTDKDDYQPGDVVHLTGYGWQAGDVLDLVLLDDPQTHEPIQWSVEVGTDGTFYDGSYVVDAGDLDVKFTLTATSRLTGRSLTVNFSDANITNNVAVAPGSISVIRGNQAVYNITVNFGGNGADCTSPLSVTGLPVGAVGTFNPISVTGGPDDLATSVLTITTTASGATATPAGTTTFTVTAALGTGCTGSARTATGVLVVSGPATKLLFGQQPTNRTSTQAFSPAVTVRVVDAANNLVGSSSAEVTLAIGTNPGGGTLSGGLLVQSAVNGVATFPGLSIDKIGTGYTLRASSLGLTPDAISTPFNVTLGAANKLAFTTQPSAAAPGAALSPAPIVAVQDAGGNTVTTSTAPIALTLIQNGNTGTLACMPSTTRNAVAGSATFTGCSVSAAGTGYQLSVTSTGLAPATSSAFDIVVNNKAPVANAGADKSGDEGSAIQLDGSASSDPDGATDLPLTFSWTVVTPLVGFASGAACSLDTPTLEKPSVTCTDNGTVKVKLQVTDKRGLVSANVDEVEVTVNNAKPTATFAAAPGTLNEGSSYALSLTSPADPSSVDVAAGFTYAFDCGLGAGYSAPGSSSSANCLTNDNGSPTAKGKIIDKDGGFLEYTASVTVQNVAPTATFTAPSEVQEGSDIHLALTSPQDPSGADVTAGFHYAFDCGSGYSGATSYLTAGTASTKDCPTTDDATLTVKGKIFDKDGGATEYTAGVTVKNVAPIVDAGDDQTGNEGQTFNLNGSFEDPGADDHTWSWAYTDGLPHPAACDIADPGSLLTTITCKDNGEVIVTLTIEDDDHGVGNDDLTIKIANVSPSATGLNANSPVDEGSNITLSLAGVTDPSSIDFATLHYAFECGTGDDLSTATYATAGTTNSATCPTTDNGTRTVKGKVFDKDGGASGVFSATVTINNVDPTATFSVPVSVNEGTAIALSLTNPQDPSSADLAAGFTYAFDCGAGYASPGSASTASCPTDDNGSRNVKAKIIDKDAGFTEYTGTVTINNVAPTATFTTPSSVNEGDNIALSLTNPVDPSTVDVTAGFQYAFDCGDGSGYGAFGAASSRSCPTTDNGTRSVKGKIKDKDQGVTEYTGSVAVNNVAPVITSLTIAPTVVQIGYPVTLNATFTDQGTGDTHTALINWEGTTSGGTVTESNGSGSVTGSRSYTATGIYTVTLTVTDDDGGADTEAFAQYIVVYDPSAGFVTGGGWINSPAGAYRPDLGLTGKANFGFVSKYQKGATTPTGNTEFQFHAGSLNFSSTVYDWLVVQGQSKASYKGSGTVNGAAGFGFLLSVIDNGSSGDKFRMKIWNKTSGAIVYDNQFGSDDEASAAQYIAGGSIVIHTSGGVASK